MNVNFGDRIFTRESANDSFATEFEAVRFGTGEPVFAYRGAVEVTEFSPLRFVSEGDTLSYDGHTFVVGWACDDEGDMLAPMTTKAA